MRFKQPRAARATHRPYDRRKNEAERKNEKKKRMKRKKE